MPHLTNNLEVVRVRTRETLARPDIAQLIIRGAAACGFPEPTAIIAELLVDPGAHNTGLFVGCASREPQVVAIGYLPGTAFSIAAQVALAYSERASRELVEMVGAALREWFEEHGHDHAHALNSQHTDRAYMRGLKHFGRAARVGSVIEFRFDE